MGDQLLVGGVGDGEDVLRSFELGHEGGRILEHLRDPFALRRGRALRQHALGGLDHNGDHAARLAVLGDHRRVEEIHPAALGLAAAIEDQLAVLVLQRAAGHADRHDMAVEVGRFGPGVEHRQAEDSGMPIAGEAAIGVVVEHDTRRSPQQHQRHRRVQHQAQRGLEAGRPVRGGAKRRRPVMVANEAGHLAAPGQEGQLCGLAWRSPIPPLAQLYKSAHINEIWAVGFLLAPG